MNCRRRCGTPFSCCGTGGEAGACGTDKQKRGATARIVRNRETDTQARADLCSIPCGKCASIHPALWCYSPAATLVTDAVLAWLHARCLVSHRGFRRSSARSRHPSSLVKPRCQLSVGLTQSHHCRRRRHHRRRRRAPCRHCSNPTRSTGPWQYVR